MTALIPFAGYTLDKSIVQNTVYDKTVFVFSAKQGWLPNIILSNIV